MATTIRPSREVREKEEEVAATLVLAGWKRATGGWRHPRLYTVWPTMAAAKLQEEAEKGMQDVACRLVRGEAT